MKRILILSLAFLLSGLMVAQKGYNVSFLQSGQEIELTFTLEDYDVSRIKKGNDEFSSIVFDGSVFTTEKGFAQLPYIHAAVMLDNLRNYSLEIVGTQYEDVKLDYPMLPSRGVIYRDQDPSTIPYVIDEKSLVDEFYPASIARQTDPYILRDVRGANVYVHAFRYNAVQEILRVYTSVKVRLVQNNTSPINPLNNQAESIVRELDGVYNSVFVNYGANRDDLTIGEYGDIHVICTPRDETAIDPYIQWKREKGFNVTKEVVATGTNVTTNVQTAYDNNNDLLYVLIVGDWQDIKSNTLSGYYPMDPQLGCVVGTDDYADICIGRFSANNSGYVTSQVDKVISYEQTPDIGASWYSTATGIASDEGPGDDNEYDYEHNDVIYNDKLDPFTYDNFNDIYEPSASVSMINTAVNSGTSVINYTGHGSPTSWGTTGFNNSNVNQLSNGDKMPFVISVACNNGEFNMSGGDCFAEAWAKKDNGGSIIFMGASISQPWNPPMRGQDYFMDVMIGGYDYAAHAGQNGITTDEQRTTFGAMIFNGLTLMCTESGGSSDWETAKTWNMFGDPSLQVRTATPEAVTLSSTLVMTGIPYTTTVTAAGSPFEGAMVTLSQGSDYFTAITDASGNVSINHTLSPGDALLVVTGFNLETVYQTITVAPSNGAYVIYDSHDVNDATGNNNGLIDYAETVKLGVSLSNVGTDDATNVNVTLTSSDVYTTIVDGTEAYGTIPAGQTVYIADAFEISVSGDIPDMHTIMFDLESTGDNSWNSSFTDQGHAPVLGFVSIVISDPLGNANGRLDPGETAELMITIENSGSADAYNVQGDLSTASGYVNIQQGSMTYGTLAAGNTAVQNFEVTADGSTPPGQSASFDINMNADHGIQASDDFYVVIGQIPVVIIDLDANHSSGPLMMQCFMNLGVGADIVANMPDDLNLYATAFVCLGIYPNNHVLTTAEGQKLADYLNNGGKVYMEGGDTWYYDSQTAVHPLFGITGLNDGGDDLGTVMGESGTFTTGMNYDYSGESNWIDQLAPVGDAFNILKNQSPSFVTAIANEETNYKTIGASHEFGGFDDGTYTKDELMKEYLIFFDMDGLFTSVDEATENIAEAIVYPNPAHTNASIGLSLEKAAKLSIELYNQQGQIMYSLNDREFSQGKHVVDLKEISIFNPGIYFIRIITGKNIITKKLVIMH